MALGITVSDLIERTVDQLTPSASPRLDILATGITTAAGSFGLQHLDAAEVPPGTQVSIGNELVHVLNNTTATAVAVYRGFRGTAAREHPSGTEIWVGEAVPRPLIHRHLKSEISAWPNDVFAVRVLELSVPAHAESIDLDGAADLPTLRWLLRVEAAPRAGGGDDRWLPLANCRLRTRTNTTTYPSGYALDFGGTVAASTTVRVHLATDFDLDLLDDLTTDLEDIGFTEHLALAVPDCMLYRLAQSGELIRSQGGSAMGPADADAVPAEHSIRTQEAAYRVRQRRLSTEVVRLQAEYPPGERKRP